MLGLRWGVRNKGGGEVIISSVFRVARSCGGKGHESNAVTSPSPRVIPTVIVGEITHHSRGRGRFLSDERCHLSRWMVDGWET